MATVVDSLIIKLGLDPAELKKGLDAAKRDTEQADRHFDTLGAKWGRGLMSIATRMAAPIAGAFSIGKMISSYTSSVAQVAQMTGRYSSKLEEWRLKRAALSRVTKEDIDLYIKVRKALTSFNIAMADLSAKIVRIFAPAVKLATEWLNKISSWVSNNSQNIIRFLTVIAGIMTALLIPAIIRMGRALLTNPLTWIIVLLGLLAIAIDDLIVYMRGGKSQFAEFWAMFGTAEELTEDLNTALEWLKTTGKDLLPWIIKIGAAFAGWKILATIGSLAVKAISGIIAAAVRLFSVIRAHPFLLLLTAIWMWYENWDEICDGAQQLWSDFCGLVAHGIDRAAAAVSYAIEAIAGWWDSMIDGAVQLWGDLKSAFMAVIDALVSAWNGLKDAFIAVIDAVRDAWNAMLDAVLDKVNAVIGAIGGAIQKAKEAMGLATSDEERNRVINTEHRTPEHLKALEEVRAHAAAREAAKAAAAAGKAPPIVNGAGAAAGRAAGAAGAQQTVNNNQTINVNGAGDPEAVAQNVVSLEQSGGGISWAADSGVIQ